MSRPRSAPTERQPTSTKSAISTGLTTDNTSRSFIAVAAQNGCSFCTDLALARVVKGKIGLEKFNVLLCKSLSAQTIFSEKEKAIFAFVKEYAEIRKVTDKTFAELKRLFNETEIVEMIAINAFEQYFNALAIPLEIESDGLQKLVLA